uniref:chorismate mutase n=1 Tax=Globodera rostochiensis TaxID=31243 RepID=A0A914HKH9_GLORO
MGLNMLPPSPTQKTLSTYAGESGSKSKAHENNSIHEKHSGDELSKSGKTKRHIAHSPNKKESKQSKKQHFAKNKQSSLQSCEERGRHYVNHCIEMSTKNGQCHENKFPMRKMDCLHLKKFINTNLHTLVEEPTGGETHQHHSPRHADKGMHPDGEHVGAFVTANNVMCCSVDMGSSLQHAIQLINDRLLFAHEVALYKFAHNIPIENPELEASVLKSVGNQANAAGIDAEFAVNFLLAQMEANKMIQQGYITRWESDHSFESKYVPDLEKEIRPKMSSVTNALILALIPLVDAGHQLYNDKNCIKNVEKVLESLGNLRARDLEPNGTSAMERAVKGICDKETTHAGQIINKDQEKGSSKRRNAIGKEERKTRHNESKLKAKKEHSKISNNGGVKVQSPSSRAKIQKISPRRIEIAAGKVTNEDDEHHDSSHIEWNRGKKKIQNKIVQKLVKRTGENKERELNDKEREEEKPKSLSYENDGNNEYAETKTPRRIAVSDRSIMVKTGDKTREVSDEVNHEAQTRPKIVDKTNAIKENVNERKENIGENRGNKKSSSKELVSRDASNEAGFARTESDANDSALYEVKTDQKKSPRRIEVSDRSIMIKAGDKTQEMGNSMSHESLTRPMTMKKTIASNELKNEQSQSAEFDNEKFGKKRAKQSSDESRPKRMESDLDDRSLIVIENSNESREVHAEKNKKDTKNTIGDNSSDEKDGRKDYSNESVANYSIKHLRKTDVSQQDKSKNEPEYTKNQSSSYERTRRIGKKRANQEESRQQSEISAEPAGFSSKTSSEPVEKENGAVENPRKSKFSMKQMLASDEENRSNYHQREATDQNSKMNNKNTVAKKEETLHEKKDDSDEFHHIELEPDAESIVIHTGGEKPVKIKLGRKKAVKEKETTNGEENDREKKIRSEGSEEQMLGKNEANFNKKLAKKLVDKSNEYVEAPEKISSEFSEKSADITEKPRDHWANYENNESNSDENRK